MPGIEKRTRNHADRWADLEDIPAIEQDPEDEVALASQSDDHDQRNGEVEARPHYAPVGKSQLRRSTQTPLGPQYSGSAISRNGALAGQSSRDPFEEYGSEEESDEHDGTGIDDEEDMSGIGDASSADDREDMRGDVEESDSIQNQEEFADSENEDLSEVFDGDPGKDGTNREELRRLINDERRSISASIAEANKTDVEKGWAVKAQRQTFDALLNGRIRLQQGLVATNALSLRHNDYSATAQDHNAVRSAEEAALTLWNTLESMWKSMTETRTGTKRKHMDASSNTSTSQIWKHMQGRELQELKHRRATLHKWSGKTQAATIKPTVNRLNQTARPSTVLDVIEVQLANPSRLLKRTRVPRSCAPSHAQRGITESADIFDDADFYGILLKELLEQRNAEAGSGAQLDLAAQQWEAARRAGKTKKNVDTKASKGRKLRYTVHEKLQNFMAPEDRGTWGQRQVDELFGSLLGRKMILGEGQGDANSAEADGYESGAEEEALRLFRN